MLQIVLGSISVLLAGIILLIPGTSISTTILLLSLILLVLGIERICFGVVGTIATTATTATKASKYNASRITNIALGLLVIGLSIVLMEFPVFSTALLIILAAIALLIVGIARIIHGIKGDDNQRATQRYLSLGTGILCVVVSILIIANPTTLGLLLLVFILSISLIIVGISMIVRAVRAEGNTKRKVL